jgi:hypothetical protein
VVEIFEGRLPTPRKVELCQVYDVNVRPTRRSGNWLSQAAKLILKAHLGGQTLHLRAAVCRISSNTRPVSVNLRIWIHRVHDDSMIVGEPKLERHRFRHSFSA